MDTLKKSKILVADDNPEIIKLLEDVLTKKGYEVIKASNRPAAAVESMRNRMIEGLGAIATSTLQVNRLPKRHNGG